MPDLDPKYVAGIFDGEGCVRVSQRYAKHLNHKVIQLSLNISNTNQKLIKAIKANFGGYVIVRKRELPRKTVYDWEITGLTKIENFLKLILPHLIVKKEQVLLALKFISQREHIQHVSPKKRNYSSITLKTYLKLKQLNQGNSNNAKPEIWLK